MLDSDDGQLKPCPECGSASVRWRRRRWYDAFPAVLAYLTNSFAGALSNTTRGMPSDLRSTPMGDWHDAPARKASEIEQQIVDERVAARSWLAPRYFWNCPCCKGKGQVFAD